jgi:hypothetical protein
VVSFNIIALGKKQILRECNETNIEDDISKVILLRSDFFEEDDNKDNFVILL